MTGVTPPTPPSSVWLDLVDKWPTPSLWEGRAHTWPCLNSANTHTQLRGVRRRTLPLVSGRVLR